MLNGHQSKPRIEYGSGFGLMKIVSLLAIASRDISQAEGEAPRLCSSAMVRIQNGISINPM